MSATQPDAGDIATIEPLDQAAAPGIAFSRAAGRGTPPPLTKPMTEPYDENLVRRQISYWLLWLLSGILAVSFLIFGVIANASDPAVGTLRFTEFIALLQVIFGPMIALVSSVIGFYFGARTVTDGKDP